MAPMDKLFPQGEAEEDPTATVHVEELHLDETDAGQAIDSRHSTAQQAISHMSCQSHRRLK